MGHLPAIQGWSRIGNEPTRVLRGGGFVSGARLMRFAYRDWVPPSDTDVSSGFRCARGIARASTD